MLSQQNFLSFIAGHKISLRNLGRSGEDEVHLSILPMPHVYERIVVMYEILIGSFIVYPKIYLGPPQATYSRSRTI